MKNLILSTILALVVFFSTFSAVDALVRVKGYTKKNGTYVQPHYRTNPNTRTYDNWSTKGNVNPYTGKKGTLKWYR